MPNWITAGLGTQPAFRGPCQLRLALSAVHSRKQHESLSEIHCGTERFSIRYRDTRDFFPHSVERPYGFPCVTEFKKQTGFNGSGRPCSAALGLGRVQGLFFGKEGKWAAQTLVKDLPIGSLERLVGRLRGGRTCFTKCILRVGKRAVVTRARAKGMGRRCQMDFKISIFGVPRPTYSCRIDLHRQSGISFGFQLTRLRRRVSVKCYLFFSCD
jgi:hypothetical protein